MFNKKYIDSFRVYNFPVSDLLVDPGVYKVGPKNYHGPSKPTFLEVFMVNNLVFKWPKPLFFMVLGAHGSYK